MNIWRTELQRARWRFATESLHIANPEDGAFCSDVFGFGSDPYVRLVILPSDPANEIMKFDAEFWAFLQALLDPVLGGKADWGAPVPGRRAALLAKSSEKKLDRYLAVMRSGAVEMALGNDAVFHWMDRSWFRLLTVVGRFWAALEAFQAIRAGYSLSGPYRVTLGVRGSLGAPLSHVAQGWDQYWEGAYCQEPCVLHVLQIDDWHDDAAQSVAFNLAQRLEESFGSTDSRFLNREGEQVGQFGKATYRWN